jgi:hypothetical protein
MAQVTDRSPLRLMLEASHGREVRRSARWTVGIAALGVLNLFLCAYLEGFVSDGAEGFMLFLAIESSFLLLTGAAVVNGDLQTISRSTRVFPMTSSARFYFVFLSLLRHRGTLIIALTMLFAVALLGPRAPISVAGRVVMAVLLELFLFSAMSMLTVLRVRPGGETRSLLALAGLILASLLVLTAVVTPGPILNIIYPLRWTTTGVYMIHHGETLLALRYAGYLMMSAGACVLIGRRYA